MPEIMPVPVFEPGLQNTQRPMLWGTENSRHPDISGQGDSLLANHPVLLAPLLNQLSNQLIPDQQAPLIPDQPAGQSTMVPIQAALSPDQ